MAISGDSAVALQVLWVLASCMLAIAVHETGHVLCAAATGIAIRQMTIGAGRLLLSRRIGDTLLELRAVPVLGFVIPYSMAAVN